MIYNDQLNKAAQDLIEAKKDNDFIYHERIPDVKSLEPVPKAVIAKTSPANLQLSSKFKGIYLNKIIYSIVCFICNNYDIIIML